MQKADSRYMLETGDMISVEPECCLMPECSGLEIIQSVEAFCDWMFQSLPGALHSVNLNLEVD